jgi:hypothetical protein
MTKFPFLRQFAFLGFVCLQKGWESLLLTNEVFSSLYIALEFFSVIQFWDADYFGQFFG